MFRIDWDSEVQLELLELWAFAPQRLQARISAAINKLENRLALDPFQDSESRDDDKHVTFEPPLGIEFTVDRSTMTVHIERAWLIKEHS